MFKKFINFTTAFGAIFIACMGVIYAAYLLGFTSTFGLAAVMAGLFFAALGGGIYSYYTQKPGR